MTQRAARRHFLKSASALSFLGTASPFALNLATIGSAAAQVPGEYRALICLFLFGGNDHTNTVIPLDIASHTEYFNARSTIALGPVANAAATDAASSRAALAASSIGAIASQGGREFALHPQLSAIRRYFTDGTSRTRAAVVANIGPLVVPMDRALYNSRPDLRPPKLFSHNDQQSMWQAHRPIGEGAQLGWGGRVGDLLASGNTQPLFTAMSAAGNTVWLSGNSVRQFQVSSGGPVQMSAVAGGTLFGSSTSRVAYERMITRTGTHLFDNEHAGVARRAIDANRTISAALPPTLAGPAIPSNNSLANQLNVVARTIAARTAIGATRQVFFVSIGGYDNHDFLLDQHVSNLGRVNTALAAFWQWIEAMNLERNVTLFTASDFGRTLTSNGDGSDHGWGSHQFVMGGAVNGGNMYGTFPPTAFNTSQDVGSGSLLPTTAVDQYAATLGRWLGVSDTNIPLALPNVANFGASRYITGLMQA